MALQAAQPSAPLESQSAVLSLCLTHPEVWRRAEFELTPEHFDQDNRAIFTAMVLVARENGGTLEKALIADTLAEKKLMPADKTRAAVHALVFNRVNKDAAQELFRELHQTYKRRALIVSLQKALALAQTSKASLDQTAAQVEEMILEATQNAGYSQSIGAPEAVEAAYAQAQRAAEMEGFAGFRTGFPPYDKLLGGFELGHVTTLIAEMGTGKTALALQTAVGVARRAPVAFCSLEMGEADLMQRAQACWSGVEYAKIRAGNLGPAERARVDEASEWLRETGLRINKRHVSTWAQIKTWFVQQYFEFGCRVFILDNVLSVDYEGRDEQEHVTLIANESQRLAHNFDVHVLNLHHTNTDEEPKLRSSHGAKAIERHSSNVLALWDEDKTGRRIKMKELKGRNVGKNYEYALFRGELQRFEPEIERLSI